MLKIKANPRIHISLIGMNADGYRINGGIGFSISDPIQVISFEPANSIKVVDNRSKGLMGAELLRLEDHLNKVRNNAQFPFGFICTIEDSIIRSHVGLGSNTIVYMSCIEALGILNNKLYTNDEVISLSGRGGTSGIGINTYFKGGFIFDTGIINEGHTLLAPSSSFLGCSRYRPLMYKRIEMPSWDLGLCIPTISPKSEEEEKAFFIEKCPIEKEDVEEILYEAVYGVSSSLMDDNFNSFCESIDAIQNTKWKQMERGIYGRELLSIESEIRNAGAKCVGMSSFGPLLYFFGGDIDSIIATLKNRTPQCTFLKASLNNSGRVLEYD